MIDHDTSKYIVICNKLPIHLREAVICQEHNNTPLNL